VYLGTAVDEGEKPGCCLVVVFEGAGDADGRDVVEAAPARLRAPYSRVRPEPDLFAEVKTLLGEAAIT
jgi:hypothetical protein